MGHHLKSASNYHYEKLRKRLDMHPVGAPRCDGIYEVLKTIFTVEQAEFVSALPLRFFSLEEASKRTGKSKLDTRRILDELCALGVVLDFEKDGKFRYVLVPTFTGFLEFIFMRKRTVPELRSLSAILDLYLHRDGDLLRQFIGGVHIGRAVVREDSIQHQQWVEVLDYEKATYLIEEAKAISVGLCYCRHVQNHLGKDCGRQMDVCMTLGAPAVSLVRHGSARAVEKTEALDILCRARESDLVQICDNVKRHPTYMCHCCPCCCVQLRAVRQKGTTFPVQTSNFIARLDSAKCTGCGVCLRSCPVGAISLRQEDNPDPKKKKRVVSYIDEEICLGCGICEVKCRVDAITMERRAQRILYPEDVFERLILQAIDKGRLHYFVFDNPDLMVPKIAQWVAGIVLKRDVMKKILSTKQVRSALLSVFRSQAFPANFYRLFT